MDNRARLAFAVVLVLGAVGVYFLTSLRDNLETGACEARYRRARTASDTAMIDLQRAPMERGRGGAMPVPTCGELRHSATDSAVQQP
jgi:hypothetical protein